MWQLLHGWCKSGGVSPVRWVLGARAVKFHARRSQARCRQALGLAAEAEGVQLQNARCGSPNS